MGPMTSRLLILCAAFGFAACLAGGAIAKPPEEEAADRAEKAAERAAKAAERASEAADRAAEREARDRNDRDPRSSDVRDSGKDISKDGDKNASDRSSSDGDKDSKDSDDHAPEKVDFSKPEANAPLSGSTPGGSGDDGGSQSLSGSTPGGSGDDSSFSDSDDHDDDNSGSNSGSGSSGGGDDDDDGDDDNGGSSGSGRDGGNGRQVAVVPTEKDSAGNPFREGEIVILSDDRGLVTRATALGFSVIEERPLESIGSVVARLRRPEGVTSNQALDLLRTREPASPSGYNYLYQASGKPPETIEHMSVRPPPASKNAGTIAIIDGFAGDNVGGWPVERLVDKPAKVAHGDAVAGILLRDMTNAYRVQPDKLILLDVMRENPGGGAADVSALIVAFDRLVTQHVSLVNLSLAGPDHPALRQVISRSMKSGVVVVAAVGNNGPAAPPAFPAAYDGVVGVAAVDSVGKPYMYSGRGPHVDIAALGVEMSATTKSGELVGTSYAAPHVTAMIAGARISERSATVDALLSEYAQDAGAPGRDPVYGLGILTLNKPARVAQAAQSNN